MLTEIQNVFHRRRSAGLLDLRNSHLSSSEPKNDLLASLFLTSNRSRSDTVVRLIDVKASRGSGHDNLHVRPGAGLKIHIGLIQSRLFLAQAIPGILRLGGVLNGMISVLILGRPEFSRVPIFWGREL